MIDVPALTRTAEALVRGRLGGRNLKVMKPPPSTEANARSSDPGVDRMIGPLLLHWAVRLLKFAGKGPAC